MKPLNVEDYKTKYVNVDPNDPDSEIISYYELSRWMSLIEAIDLIDKKANQLHIGVNSNAWVKPLAIQKYIDERTESMLFECLTEDGEYPE